MINSLVHILKNVVRHSPNIEAIVDEKSRISYEQLWEYILSIAHHLKKQGLKKNERVAILIDNSVEYVSIYYGVQAAGGITVGLNTSAMVRDLDTWIEHSGATWLFANARHPELPKLINSIEKHFKLVLIGDNNNIKSDFNWKDIISKKYVDLDLSVINNPDDPAAIMYTSGTTGTPKGVTLSHKNLVTNIQSILAYLKLTEKDRVLNVLPFYYTYGNSVLHTHLAVGGTIIIENSMMYPHKILERMVSEKVTGFSGVPSTYALLLGRTNISDFNLSKLRYMTQAGGPMPPANIKKLLGNVPHIQFFVMYGQTEASARLTYLPPDQIINKLGSVGIPIPGVEITIQDENENVLKNGVTGEICARGDNIMLGYWNDPDSTKNVIKNGWLHTGDLAHMDNDGFIYIDGRSSDMIKSGGNRISPKEIEEVIAEIQEVLEVAVIGISDNILGQIIKAIIVLRPGENLEPKYVKAYCKQNLADYKVPKIIEYIDSLPKTASGKIKRYQLQKQ